MEARSCLCPVRYFEVEFVRTEVLTEVDKSLLGVILEVLLGEHSLNLSGAGCSRGGVYCCR
jgi:hypothetical protein